MARGVKTGGRNFGDKDSESQRKATKAKQGEEFKTKVAARRAINLAITEHVPNVRGNSRRITPEAQDYLREALTKIDAKGNSWLHSFIDSFLKEAKKDPNSRSGQLMASALFNEQLLATLDAEVTKQMAKDQDFFQYRIRQTLYPKQQQVYDDNVSRTIECICTRRAGKTELNARLLLKEVMSRPFMTPAGKPLPKQALYLNRSFDNAVSQMGKPLMELLESFDIKYTGSPGSGKLTFDNGATITYGGYNNKGDIDKYRGEHFSLIIIDEISHLRNPEVLFKETLEPAMMDYGNEAHVVMTGTPPRVKANYAYRLWHNPNITHYHWSFMDNPFIPNKDAVIEQVCKEHGVTVDAPFVQREYFGNLEAFDTDAMVFRGYKTKDDVPKNVVYDRAYIGVDFGFEDAAAVVSCLVKGRQMFVVDQWSMSKQAISTLCQEVMRQYENLKNNYQIATAISVITDTNNKEGAYELYSTYKIPNVLTAYKYDRDIAIEQLAEWARTDTVFIPSKGILQEEFDNTIWERDEEDNIKHVISDEYHPNAVFALLYVSRQFAFDALGLVETNKQAKHIEGDIYV